VTMNTASMAECQSPAGSRMASGPSHSDALNADDTSRPPGHGSLESSRVALHFDLVPQCVAQARRAAREALTSWNLNLEDPAVDTAIVVLSELLTNAVKHASALCDVADVTLSLTAGVLIVSVHDRHPYRPRALPAPHSNGDGGRGLALVRDLVAEVDGRTSVPTDADRCGKTMLVEIPVSSSALTAPGRLSARAA
jgi:anti-sigma regulatory factor (Ser/Thr protein kinase)